MTIQKLIDQYQAKIEKKDEAITELMGFIRNVKNGETTSDIEELAFELGNAQRDRQLYFQFTKDLEDLINPETKES